MQGIPQQFYTFPALRSSTTMLFSRNLFAVLIAVAAVGVNGSPVKRDDPNTIFACKGKKWGAECDHFPVNLGVCTDVRSDYNDLISSFGPPPDVTCHLYE